MQTNLKENPAIGVAGRDEENGGKQFSIPIVPPLPQTDGGNRRGAETIAAVLARVYRLVIAASEACDDGQ